MKVLLSSGFSPKISCHLGGDWNPRWGLDPRCIVITFWFFTWESRWHSSSKTSSWWSKNPQVLRSFVEKKASKPENKGYGWILGRYLEFFFWWKCVKQFCSSGAIFGPGFWYNSSERVLILSTSGFVYQLPKYWLDGWHWKHGFQPRSKTAFFCMGFGNDVDLNLFIHRSFIDNMHLQF